MASPQQQHVNTSVKMVSKYLPDSVTEGMAPINVILDNKEMYQTRPIPESKPDKPLKPSITVKTSIEKKVQQSNKPFTLWDL